MKWRIMMDDVFIYHAHTLFSLSNMWVGPNVYLSTSIEHELTKRALESIIHDVHMESPKYMNVYLPPLHDDDALSSRTTFFEEGGADTGWTTVTTISCDSPTIHTPHYHSKVNLLLYVMWI